MLTYQRLDHLEIVGYSNYYFPTYFESTRSTSGYVFMLAGGAVFWKSVKQILIASSTIKVDFVAYYEVSNQEIWITNFIIGMQIFGGIETPLKNLFW